MSVLVLSETVWSSPLKISLHLRTHLAGIRLLLLRTFLAWPYWSSRVCDLIYLPSSFSMMWLSGGALVNIVPTNTCVSHKECWITLQQPRSSMWKPRWRYLSSVSNRVLLVYGPKNWGGATRVIVNPIPQLFSTLLSTVWQSLAWPENRKVGQSLPKDSEMDWMYVPAECVGSYCQAWRGINEVGPETVSLQDKADLLRSIYKLDKRREIINQ